MQSISYGLLLYRQGLGKGFCCVQVDECGRIMDDCYCQIGQIKTTNWLPPAHHSNYYRVERWNFKRVNSTFCPQNSFLAGSQRSLVIPSFLFPRPRRLCFLSFRVFVQERPQDFGNGVNAPFPLPPESKKIMKIWLRNGAFWSILPRAAMHPAQS